MLLALVVYSTVFREGQQVSRTATADVEPQTHSSSQLRAVSDEEDRVDNDNDSDADNDNDNDTDFDMPSLPFDDGTSFVPYPHRLVGLGKQLSCEWKTANVLTENELTLLLGPRPAGKSHHEGLDELQQTMLRDGVCIPKDKRTFVRLFSRQSALRCLSGTTMLFGGHDSFADVYTGVAEILSPNLMVTKQMDDEDKDGNVVRWEDPLDRIDTVVEVSGRLVELG